MSSTTPTPKKIFDGACARGERAPHLERHSVVRAQESNPGSYRSYLRTRGREIVNDKKHVFCKIKVGLWGSRRPHARARGVIRGGWYLSCARERERGVGRSQARTLGVGKSPPLVALGVKWQVGCGWEGACAARIPRHVEACRSRGTCERFPGRARAIGEGNGPTHNPHAHKSEHLKM